MNVSQSALSSQIQTLEQQIGHDLFERRGRRLILTEAGRVALDHADAIFERGEELLSTLSQTGQTRRALRVGALSTLSRNFLIGFLAPVIGRPDTDVILRSGSTAGLLQSLADLSLDIVLINRAPSPDFAQRAVVHKLAEVEVSLVGRPTRLVGSTRLEDLLAKHPLILPSTESSIRLGFDALVDRLGIRPSIAAEVDDMAMMRLLARSDAGLAVVPRIVVRDELRSKELVEATDLKGISETFHAVTIDRRFPNPLVKDLIQASSGALDGQP